MAEECDSDYIKLIVINNKDKYNLAKLGSEVHFRVKKNTAMRKLMQSHCERLGGLPLHVMKYEFRGRQLLDEDTAGSFATIQYSAPVKIAIVYT